MGNEYLCSSRFVSKTVFTTTTIVRLLIFLVWLPLCAPGGVSVTVLTHSELASAVAVGGDVTFATSGTLVLTNTIHVAADTTLKANGQSVLISGGNSVRLFQVYSNVSFQIEGFVLANGRVLGSNGPPSSPPIPGEAARGAAILNQGGTVTLIDCTLTNHYARGGDAGQDTAGETGGIGGAAFGGAIWSLAGELNLTNCVLANNRAEGGKGSWAHGVISGDASGGGIYVEAGLAMLDLVEFTANTVAGGEAVGGGGLYTGGAGKGGDSRGGAMYATNAVVTISRARVVANLASTMINDYETNAGTDSGSAEGGAFFISSNCLAEVHLSAFETNAAIGALGRRNEPAGRGEGGAIYCQGSLSVFDSTFSTNKALGGSGRYVGTASGGAIFSTFDLSISGSTFHHNEVKAGDFGGPNGISEGGGVRSAGGLFITNSTFSLNKAIGGGPDSISYIGGPARGGQSRSVPAPRRSSTSPLRATVLSTLFRRSLLLPLILRHLLKEEPSSRPTAKSARAIASLPTALKAAMSGDRSSMAVTISFLTTRPPSRRKAASTIPTRSFPS